MSAPKKKSGAATKIIFAILLLMFVAPFLPKHHDSGADVSYTSQDSANSACQVAITDDLTAPATAHWHDRTVTAVSGGYSVAGQVDSQNDFGAVLTTSYGCDEDSDFVVQTAY
jgi:hypothetical protein